jgi:hypothetical protein
MLRHRGAKRAGGGTRSISGSLGGRRGTGSTCNASRKPFEGPAFQREYQIFTLLTSQRIADKVYYPSRKQHWHAKLWRIKGDSTWHAQSFEFPEATATGETKAEVREKLLDEICYCMMATQERARKARTRLPRKHVAPVTHAKQDAMRYRSRMRNIP